MHVTHGQLGEGGNGLCNRLELRREELRQQPLRYLVRGNHCNLISTVAV